MRYRPAAMHINGTISKPFDKWIAVILLCCTPLLIWAQPPVPSDLCVAVNADNNLVLNWAEPLGADPLLNYEIFRDDGGGFQSIMVQGPPGNTTYVDFAADPLVENAYYVRSVLGGIPSAATDTVRNVVLNLDASVPTVAQLSWNGPYGSFAGPGEFEVRRTVAQEAEQVIATLASNVFAYDDTLFAYCEDTMVTYQVVYQRAFCEMASQRVSDEFRDIMPPPQPVIETASVDPESGDILLYWDPVDAPDLAFYRVQDIDLVNQQFVNIGFVPAGQPTEFNYVAAGLNGEKTLAVIAFDGCGNDASFAGTATTMYAEADYGECDTDALVTWTSYEGWDEGVSAYKIMASIDGAPAVEVGEVDGSESMFLAPVEPNLEYCFYVLAVSAGTQRDATSNEACVLATYPTVAEDVYLSSVNVLTNSSLEVNMLQDLNAVGTTYELFRARQTGGFISLGTFNQTADPVLTYVDEELDTRNLKYTYKWELKDGCGFEIGETNIGTNIVMTVVADSKELKNYVTWTPYEQWENGVSEYEVWRKLGSQEAYELYATVDSDVLVFEDDVDSFRFEEGEFCYQIVAIEAPNSLGVPGASASFGTCVTQPPVMWIPSAIVINGLPENQVFKPVAGFIDFDSYRMEVYNKWGQLIFDSDDIEIGWDGTYRGNVVREDYFRYIISYRDGSGNPYVEQDVLFVLKK